MRNSKVIWGFHVSLCSSLFLLVILVTSNCKSQESLIIRMVSSQNFLKCQVFMVQNMLPHFALEEICPGAVLHQPAHIMPLMMAIGSVVRQMCSVQRAFTCHIYLNLILTTPYGVGRELLFLHFTDVEMEVLFILISLPYRCALESLQIMCW